MTISGLVLFAMTVMVSGQKLDMEKFREFKARSIGPAGMSGRVTAIDVVKDKPSVMYVGTASGGL